MASAANLSSPTKHANEFSLFHSSFAQTLTQPVSPSRWLEFLEALIQQQQQLNSHAVDQHSTSVTVPASKAPIGMDAGQAARSLYPSIAKPLQKYLRSTRQTSRHNLQSIYEHLAKCLLYKLNARAFLEKFVNLDPILQENETKLFSQCRLANLPSQLRVASSSGELEINSWSLICDTLLSRQIRSGKWQRAGNELLEFKGREREREKKN